VKKSFIEIVLIGKRGMSSKARATVCLKEGGTCGGGDVNDGNRSKRKQ
jgi:hypothetical protein